MRISRALLLLPLALCACDDPSLAVLTVELIDPGTGGNPALEVTSGTLSVEVEEGGVDRCGGATDCRVPITRGEFSLELPIAEAVMPTRVQARIEGGPTTLVGASPFFATDELLADGTSVDSLEVRVPMLPLAPGGRCVAFEAPNVAIGGLPRLATSRRDAGVAVRRNIALVVGGVEEGGASTRVDRFDQATAQMLTELDDVAAMGPTRGLTISENLSLFVGSQSLLFRFVPREPPAPTGIGIHGTASGRSALVRLSPDRFAVVAGTDSDAVTWLSRTGGTPQGESLIVERTSSLVTARTDAVAAPLGDAVLVVGGAAAGAPEAERAGFGRDGEAIDLPGDLEGRGGWLLASPDGDSFLWIGRVLADDTVASDTVLLTGCPACAAEAGPAWTEARPGAAGVLTSGGTFWLVGGGEPPTNMTELVRWAGGQPTIEPGPDLVASRAGASVVEHASGIVSVFGGLGDASAGLRDDLELCLAGAGLDPY